LRCCTFVRRRQYSTVWRPLKTKQDIKQKIIIILYSNIRVCLLSTFKNGSRLLSYYQWKQSKRIVHLSWDALLKWVFWKSKEKESPMVSLTRYNGTFEMMWKIIYLNLWIRLILEVLAAPQSWMPHASQ